MFSYIELLLPNMTQRFINTSNLGVLEQTVARPNVTQHTLLQTVDELLQEPMTLEQQQLLQAVSEELTRETLRVAVLRALLPAVPTSFLQTALEERIQQFVNAAWYYMKTK